MDVATLFQSSVTWNILLAIVVGIIGYAAGNMRAFRDAKQKAYENLVPTIIRFAYKNPLTEQDEVDFAIALAQLWLYANKKSALKMETAVSRIVDERRGNKTLALQEAICAMRNDVQYSWIRRWTKLKCEQINHLYVPAAPEVKRKR